MTYLDEPPQIAPPTDQGGTIWGDLAKISRGSPHMEREAVAENSNREIILNSVIYKEYIRWMICGVFKN